MRCWSATATPTTAPTCTRCCGARGADLLLAEASFPERVPADVAGFLSSARQAGEHAAAAGAGRLLLTHLLPGTAPGQAEDAARAGFPGTVGVARGGVVAASAEPRTPHCPGPPRGAPAAASARPGTPRPLDVGLVDGLEPAALGGGMRSRHTHWSLQGTGAAGRRVIPVASGTRPGRAASR